MIELVKANLNDISDMQKLIEDKVKEGIILKREDDEVATNIRSYILAKDNKKIIGYGALHIHSPSLAEIRSLIIEQEYQGLGIGKRVVKFALEEASKLGVKKVLVLTYVAKFFEQLSFSEIPKESIPEHKIWADCINCIHFPICNEKSLIYIVKE